MHLVTLLKVVTLFQCSYATYDLYATYDDYVTSTDQPRREANTFRLKGGLIDGPLNPLRDI